MDTYYMNQTEQFSYTQNAFQQDSSDANATNNTLADFNYQIQDPQEDLLAPESFGCPSIDWHNLNLEPIVDLPLIEDINLTFNPVLLNLEEEQTDNNVAANQASNQRKIRAGVKKIDMKAQKYILEDESSSESETESIDVETVSDNEEPGAANMAVAPAQSFSAPAHPDVSPARPSVSPSRPHVASAQPVVLTLPELPLTAFDGRLENVTIDEEMGAAPPVLQAQDVDSLLELFEGTQATESSFLGLNGALPEILFENDVDIKQEIDCNWNELRTETFSQMIVKEERLDEDERNAKGVLMGEGTSARSFVKREEPVVPIVQIKKEIEEESASKELELKSVDIYFADYDEVVTQPETIDEPDRPSKSVPEGAVATAAHAPGQDKPKISTISINGKQLKVSEFIPYPLMVDVTCQSSQPQPVSKIKSPIPTGSDRPDSNNKGVQSVPEEVLNRIKQLGKRKPISVIPPMPNTASKPKKRSSDQVQPKKQKKSSTSDANATASDIRSYNNKLIRMDHNYCCSILKPVAPTAAITTTTTTTVATLATTAIATTNTGTVSTQVKHHKKDDERSLMINQPTVKNADGTLMVSLLKRNTIAPGAGTQQSETVTRAQKKKLNLEEYKKRRDLKIKPKSRSFDETAQTTTPTNPEDDQTKILRHQEKLMNMAKAVLNAAPKAVATGSASPPTAAVPLEQVPVPATKGDALPPLPETMEMKTIVSIGVNTARNFAPVEQLEEIKPLLKKVKFDSSSLISSLIENIPKVASKHLAEEADPSSSGIGGGGEKTEQEHGEDKTIVYLPKDRASVKTRSIEVQTTISLIAQEKEQVARYRRRRNSSCSSSYSSSSGSSSSIGSDYDRRRNAACSTYSISSCSRSSRSYRSTPSYRSCESRSRSRSPTARVSKRRRSPDPERLQEVEERRVIYVGRIARGTTKDDLRRRFCRFGVITNVSLHFRDNDHGDSYGFVTFANKLDAYEAIEHGNDEPYFPKYDLSFGGRRLFCKTTYSDLDNMREDSDYFSMLRPQMENSFDKLLREAKEKLKRRKT